MGNANGFCCEGRNEGIIEPEDKGDAANDLIAIGELAALVNAQGPNLNCITACAASSQAVGEAVEIGAGARIDDRCGAGALREVFGEYREPVSV